LDPDTAEQALSHWGLTARDWRKRLAAKHIFTHVEWRMTGYSLLVSGSGDDRFFWADGADLDEKAMPSAFAKYLAEARTLLAAPQNDTN
jgi:A/G-specific adenine glycosylase